jgi:hypothetical protein
MAGVAYKRTQIAAFGRCRVNDPRLWFGPKRFGVGFSPRTREGWLVVLAAVLVLFVVGRMAG